MIKRLTQTLMLASLLAPVAFAGPPGLERRGGPGPRGEVPPMHVVDEVREREDEILAWVAKHDEDGHRKLLELKERDPRLYMGQLVRIAHIIQRADRDPAVVERHRKMRRLERRMEEIVADWGSYDSGQQKSYRSELNNLVGELFELRQEERRAQVAELDAKIAELKDEIEEREKDRKAIIEDYVDQLTRAPIDL